MFSRQHPTMQSIRMGELLAHIRQDFDALTMESNRLKQVNEEYTRILEQHMTELDAIKRTFFEIQAHGEYRFKEDDIHNRRPISDDISGKRMKLDGSGGMPVSLPQFTRSIIPNASFPPPQVPKKTFDVSDALARLSSSVIPHLEHSPAQSLKFNLPPAKPENNQLPIISDIQSLKPLSITSSSSSEKLPTIMTESDIDDNSNKEKLPSLKKETEEISKETSEKRNDIEIESNKNEPKYHSIQADKGSLASLAEIAKDLKEAKDWTLVPLGDQIDLKHTLHHSSVVCCVQFCNSGKQIATGSNNLVQIFDTTTGNNITSFPNLYSDESDNLSSQTPESKEIQDNLFVRSLCYSSDDNYLVASIDSKIKIFDLSEKTIQSILGHQKEIYSLHFSPKGNHFVSGGGDPMAKIWDIRTLKCVSELGEGTSSHEEGITSVCFSPDGKNVATASIDRTIRIWDVETSKLLQQMEGHDLPVHSISFSPNGKNIISGSMDKTIKVWDLSTYSCSSTLSCHSDYVLSVGYTKGGEWIVSGSKDRTVTFWDARLIGNKSKSNIVLQAHKNSVITVSMNPVDSTFATGSGDKRARIWNYENLTLAKEV